jgi:hypothetical protein
MWTPEDRLDSEGYLKDFYKYFDHMQDGMRKIEYGQSFSQPGNKSWEAFNHGDWQLALKLQDDLSKEADRYFKSLKRVAPPGRRVRIVVEPFSDYLIWELNIFRRNERLGEVIRVIKFPEAVELVARDFIDDYVAIDNTVAYRVLYDHNGLNIGAEKSLNPETVNGAVDAFEALFKNAEPFQEFFSREVVDRVPSNCHNGLER